MSKYSRLSKGLRLESYTTEGRAIRHKWYEKCLVDKNNNVWVLSEYTLDEAIEASKTLVNCEWCVNCHHCKDSKNCLDCVDCRGYENLKNKIDKEG